MAQIDTPSVFTCDCCGRSMSLADLKFFGECLCKSILPAVYPSGGREFAAGLADAQYDGNEYRTLMPNVTHKRRVRR
jgi:hypothetical protein